MSSPATLSSEDAVSPTSAAIQQRQTVPPHPYRLVACGIVVLAGAMGVARFGFTPILPLMRVDSGLSVSGAAGLATANYVGYLLGAVAASVWPAVGRSPRVACWSTGVLTVSLAAMPLTHELLLWEVLRCVAGIASVVLFLFASEAAFSHLHGRYRHLAGWIFGGVGGGIAISGVLTLLVRHVAGGSALAWWASAVITALLVLPAWRMPAPEPATAEHRSSEAHHGSMPPPGTLFASLTVSYFLQGVGYIVAATFLVAAVADHRPSWVGDSAWIAVGLAAVPSCAVWSGLTRRYRHTSLLTLALALEAVSVGALALRSSVWIVLVTAIVFGTTFMAITNLALSAGERLGVARSAAVLTGAYGLGQVLGPLAVAPTLSGGYQPAMLIAAGLLILGALTMVLVPRYAPILRGRAAPTELP